MAICTKCGAIMHDKDMRKHKCDAADLVAEGFIKKPTTTTTEMKP